MSRLPVEEEEDEEVGRCMNSQRSGCQKHEIKNVSATHITEARLFAYDQVRGRCGR